MSHCSPAFSSNSGSASHAHNRAPAGNTFLAFADRLVCRPSATLIMRPDAQMSVALSLSLLSKYFQSTSSRLPTRLESKAGARSAA
eukprot:5600474-Prymnesium_polylepis.1